ncbi:hypothetical protein YOLOSWAG_274 [Erwinia phage vB_EamM_Yoloswag]|uniref:Uncharacterized protein n=1 Tax=Erwinia phage vB_EamM_Yoloswag TaxID=1958956 RepID=A0A1S6L3J5_9CAUD|nr:hypothetical protein HOR66_gp274 [Erwinia phage vB_EamM_Yoloswag]AQT28746.1 hypothetical protein YOLOSWAG_274 [Erwinia phage vB_EamM_Yoloswag]
MHRNVEFPNMTDKEVESFLLAPDQCNFVKVRKLEDGEWIGIYRLAYTWSVCCGIGEVTSFKYRWCFENREEAEYMFANCVDFDDEPDVDHRHTLVGHRYGSRGPRLVMLDQHGFPRW